MPVGAYVFVTCEPEKSQEVVDQLSGFKGIKHVASLFGTVDVIVYVEADDLEDLEHVVLHMRTIPGLLTTDTRVARVHREKFKPED
ncbi:MAG: Lrp/AsnC ligand binding domain-containing protein [Chloroflexi bacterium]|nr:Lrp/AsnC ligand binding domain-containing protein [Chloroflexota bacterium]